MTTDGRPYPWTRPEDLPPPAESPQWLGPAENIFGVPVLDIRAFTWNVVSTTSDQSIVAHFLSTRGSSGSEIAEQALKSPVSIPCGLVYPLVLDIASGPLFIAAVMEDKWDVFIDGPVIRVARSWTGELRFIGHLQRQATAAQTTVIDRVEAATDGDGFQRVQALRDFDFVIKAYVLGQVVPNAVPTSLDPNDHQAIALHSYAMHGRRATFATFEDV